MPLLCPCLPCFSDSGHGTRTLPLAVNVRKGNNGAVGQERPAPRPKPKHSILWRLEEILIRQCDTEDQRHGLLKFAEDILALAGAETVVSAPKDSTLLQAILAALPPGEEAKAERRSLIKVLELDGINMSILDSSMDTPLLRAIKTGNRGALDALLHTRCDINATDKYSSTCLLYAVQHNDVETVQTILQQFPQTVDLDKTDYANYTALAYAASNNNMQLCMLLLEAKARPDVNSTSPLFLAVSNNASYNLIQLLISYGASVNVSNSDGLNALAAAAKNRQPRIVSLLLESGANFSTAWYKNPAFNIALNMDHLEILKIFVDHGVDILCTNPKGFNIAHEICCQGSVEFLSYVISTTDVNLDAWNRQRRTPAHLAAQYGHRACLDVLFQAGADCWSFDPRGQTALEIALFHNRSNCVPFFLDRPVFPRQKLFSTLHVLHNDYDPQALGRKPAVGLFTSCVYNLWGEGQQVDTLFNTCAITVRRFLGQKPVSRVMQLPLPEKIKDKILSYE